MSISFTPDQVHVLQACLSVESYLASCGREPNQDAPEVYFNLRRSLVFGPLEYFRVLDRAAISGSAAQADEATRVVNHDFHSYVNCVSRAYGRFRKEVDCYRDRGVKLAVVRKYHRLLLDTLTPFSYDVEGF